MEHRVTQSLKITEVHGEKKLCVPLCKPLWHSVFQKYIFIISLITYSCVPSRPIVINRPTTPSTQTEVDNYEEDLALIRPKYGEPAMPDAPKVSINEQKKTGTNSQLIVNKQVDAIIDSISVRNKALKFAAGYRIQIYVGNERTDADAARLFTYQTFPELNPYMNFTSPTYRVRIGDFMTRIDAERYLNQVKNQYPSATIQTEKIDIKKSILIK